MEINEGIEILTKMFHKAEWFDSVGTDQFGRYVVYIKFANEETIHDVPDRVGSRQVLVHFAASKSSKASDFTNQDNHEPFPLVTEKDDVEELPSSLLQFDLSDLCKELDRLERVCGSNCLQDIFYEIHDGPNALTNNSSRYPDVRAAMEKLYNEYGFDVIYEELDG